MKYVLNSKLNDSISAKKWLWLLLSFHTIAWTLIFCLSRYTPTRDDIENIAWAHQLSFAYNRDPYLTAWLTKLALAISYYHSWSIYLFAQLAIVICIWTVWRLGLLITEPIKALISCYLLELVIPYFNINASDFNDNLLALPLWGLATWMFYQAIKRQRVHYWLLTGLCLGLAMVTKYYVVMLMVAMLVIMLTTTTGRISFVRPGLYLSAITFLVPVLPHIMALFQENWLFVNYILSEQQGKNSGILSHFIYAWDFLTNNFSSFLLPIVIFSLCFLWPPSRLSKQTTIARFDWYFLWIMAWIPLIATILFSIITGWWLRSSWGAPLMSLWGLCLITIIQTNITTVRFYSFVAIVWSLMIAMLIGTLIISITAGSTSKSNFPGKPLAHLVTKLWHKNYNCRLHYVVGAIWPAGNIAYYSIDHPAVYINGSTYLTPSIHKQDVDNYGAVLLLSSSGTMTVKNAKKRWPTLKILPPQYIAWYRTCGKQKWQVHLALLAPKHCVSNHAKPTLTQVER